jgi:hypothetical protein
MTCCPLSGSYEAGPSCWSKETPTAQKPHRCYECGETIPTGVKYEKFSGIWDGSPNRYKTCLSCVEIRDHFACEEGYLFGQLWEDMEANFFPDMKAGGPCMEGLSPAAKGRLFELRLTWLVATGPDA